MHFIVGENVWEALKRVPPERPAGGEWRIGGHVLQEGAGIRRDPYLEPDAVVVCDASWTPMLKPVKP
jgi:hypothetical protein